MPPQKKDSAVKKDRRTKGEKRIYNPRKETATSPRIGQKKKERVEFKKKAVAAQPACYLKKIPNSEA